MNTVEKREKEIKEPKEKKRRKSTVTQELFDRIIALDDGKYKIISFTDKGKAESMRISIYREKISFQTNSSLKDDFMIERLYSPESGIYALKFTKISREFEEVDFLPDGTTVKIQHEDFMDKLRVGKERKYFNTFIDNQSKKYDITEEYVKYAEEQLNAGENPLPFPLWNAEFGVDEEDEITCVCSNEKIKENKKEEEIAEYTVDPNEDLEEFKTAITKKEV